MQWENLRLSGLNCGWLMKRNRTKNNKKATTKPKQTHNQSKKQSWHWNLYTQGDDRVCQHCTEWFCFQFPTEVAFILALGELHKLMTIKLQSQGDNPKQNRDNCQLSKHRCSSLLSSETLSQENVSFSATNSLTRFQIPQSCHVQDALSSSSRSGESVPIIQGTTHQAPAIAFLKNASGACSVD